ncbi:MAG: HAMP domain-containing histidine kinase [Candidatus Binatia bacterium]|nr:HAMP domain-containing histidine kinase [Candidatus Binatia bacterium]
MALPLQLRNVTVKTVDPTEALSAGAAVSSATQPQSLLTKKRTILLLRTVVSISTAYLILFGPQGTSPLALAYIAVLLATNLALGWVPESRFHEPSFSAGLLLADTFIVLAGLYLTVGCFSQDFLVIYFFTIFLTAATQGVAQIALAAAVVSGLYAYWLWLTSGGHLGSGEWLRLPFFFIVAVFYAYVTEETKLERWRRQQSEREAARLRALLGLLDPQVARSTTRAWIEIARQALQWAFPHLRCDWVERDSLSGSREVLFAPAGEGNLLAVWREDGEPLEPVEREFCRVAAALGAELEQRQDALQAELGRMRRDLLGLVSHELRTPLHAILGYAEILESDPEWSRTREGAEMLARLRSNAEHLNQVVGDLLLLAEVRSGMAQLRTQRFDLRDLVEDLHNWIKPRLMEKRIKLLVHIDEAVPKLSTDRDKLARLLRCLLSNAVKFSSEGIVRLEASLVESDRVEIRVRDNGPGIPPQERDRIFEPLWLRESSLSRRGTGLGIGLALAKDLAIRLGGEVHCTSQPGNGTTLHVRLPVRFEEEGEAQWQELVSPLVWRTVSRIAH